jgi:hypothetical protein
MFAAGSIKASKWGYDFYRNPNKYWDSSIITLGTNLGGWSSPTLAPNGKIYCVPRASYANGNETTGTLINGVLIINPGSTKSTLPSATVYTANGTTGRPNIPIGNTVNNSGRYSSKGVLAPNGLIYFVPDFWNTNFLILNPNAGGSSGMAPTWEITPFSAISNSITFSPNQTNFSGGVLGQDGYIYLIPLNSPITCRIHPRNTTINGVTPTSDVFEIGYWNSSNSGRIYNSSLGSFRRPQDYTQSTRTDVITPSNDPPVPSVASLGEGWLSDAIAHPNGKIYVFPMNTESKSRFAFIIDPQYWGTVREISSLPSLAMSNADGVIGTFKNVFLEKKKDGQDQTTLKMYATYAKAFLTSNEQNDPRQKIVEFDPTDNSWTLVGPTIPVPGGSIPYTAASNSFLLANGMIVAGNGNGTAAIPVSISQVILTGNDVDENKILPIDKQIVMTQRQGKMIKDMSSAPVSYMGYLSGIPILGGAIGKTLISGGGGNGFLLSVKGYHPGIRYFNYVPDTDDDIYKIPDNLSDLKTSLWNAYFNKPA